MAALTADLINDNHFRIVILHCFNHCFMLVSGTGHLHPAGAANGRVRNIAITADLV